jgi:ABC-type Co2+ transport system permease subunit
MTVLAPNYLLMTLIRVFVTWGVTAMRRELFVDRVDNFTMTSNLSIYTLALRVYAI